MSRFHGPQRKGAGREAKTLRREAAKERQAEFDADVRRIAREQNVSEREARRVAAASRRMSRRVADLAQHGREQELLRNIFEEGAA